MNPFWWMLVGHAVCDYPLQGAFLAEGKNHRTPLPGYPAWILLANHALIHAGAVALATGSGVLAACEFAAHCIIDFGKSAGWYDFTTDQALHVGCKVLWYLLLLTAAS